jgi:hypothetical protein
MACGCIMKIGSGSASADWVAFCTAYITQHVPPSGGCENDGGSSGKPADRSWNCNRSFGPLGDLSGRAHPLSQYPRQGGFLAGGDGFRSRPDLLPWVRE